MKVALVTGASRGLGLEWCRQLALEQSGFGRVYAGHRSEAAPATLAALGEKVVPLRLDVTSADSVAALGSALDGVALALLVNNAGIRPEACGPDVPIDALDMDAFARTLATNVVGPTRVLAACLPALARASPGFTVVNVSSGLGSTARVRETRSLFANIGATDLAYRSSKAALNHVTACAALECAERFPGSVVVALEPGWVRTDMGTRGGKDQPPLTVEDSVNAQLKTVLGLTPADTGNFLSPTGDVVPW